MRIMIVGVGGVGGLIGARLISGTSAAVTLIARGPHLAAIRRRGLRFCHGRETLQCTPALATDKPAEAGVQDVVFIATKGYGLEDAVRSLSPVVGQDTYVIPLLNGVDTSKRIQPLLDRGIVCDGLIYVFSRITEPGAVEMTGDLLQVFLGHGDNRPDSRLEEIAALLRRAGVPACVPGDIRYEMWMKWSMMCASAQTAAYFHKTIGQMREDPEARAFFGDIVGEVLAVAAAEQVALPGDLSQRLMAQMMDMPYASTPSLMRDLAEPGKPTELFLLGGALQALGRAHGIPTPVNDRVLQRFEGRV